MRSFTIFLFIFSGLFFVNAQDQAQDRLQKFETTFQNSKVLVQSKQYKLTFSMVYNERMKTEINQKTNTVTIIQNLSKGELQTFSTNKSTIELSGDIKDYEVTIYEDNKLINIKYRVNSTNVRIAIKPDGSAILTLPNTVGSKTNWIGKLSAR